MVRGRRRCILGQRGKNSGEKRHAEETHHGVSTAIRKGGSSRVAA